MKLTDTEKREVELVWNSKTNEVTNIVLPFQTIEQVDEPRAQKPCDTAPYASRSSRQEWPQAHLHRPAL